MNKQETIEHASDIAIASVASKLTYTGAGSLGFGWLFSSESAVFFGILGVIAGNVINWWFKRKADKRAEELHILKVQEWHNTRYEE